MSLNKIFASIMPSARNNSEPHWTIMDVDLYVPKLPELAPFILLSVLIGFLLSLISFVSPYVVALSAVGVLVGGLALCMGVSLEEHGGKGLVVVIWLAAVAVLLIRLSSGKLT